MNMSTYEQIDEIGTGKSITSRENKTIEAIAEYIGRTGKIVNGGRFCQYIAITYQLYNGKQFKICMDQNTGDVERIERLI